MEGWSFLQQIQKLTIRQQTTTLLIFLLLLLIRWFPTDLACCLLYFAKPDILVLLIHPGLNLFPVSSWATLVIPMVFATIPLHADSSQTIRLQPLIFWALHSSIAFGMSPPSCSIGTLTQQVCNCHFWPLWLPSPIFLLRALPPKILNLMPKPYFQICFLTATASV